MPHHCPDRCHRCPALGGEVMPGCMGTAAMGTADPNSLLWCTCERPSRTVPYAAPADPGGVRIDALERQIRALAARVTELEGKRP